MVTLALLFSCFVQFPCDKCLSWSALKSVEGYWSCQSTQCNKFFLRPYTFSIQHFQIDSVQLHLSSLNKVLAGTSNLSHCTMIPEFEASLDWFFLDVLFHWRATFAFYHALVNTLQFIIESLKTVFWNGRSLSRNAFESLPCHGVSYSLVFSKLSTFPITLSSWWMIDIHNVVYAWKSCHFFHIPLKFTTILLCVQVTLYNNQVYKFIKVGYFPKHVKGCTVFLHFLIYHFCFQWALFPFMQICSFLPSKWWLYFLFFTFMVHFLPIQNGH